MKIIQKLEKMKKKQKIQIKPKIMLKNLLYIIKKKTYTFKIIVLGNIGVGKTSVIRRYIIDTFSDEHKTIIGCENKKKTIEIDGEAIEYPQFFNMI